MVKEKILVITAVMSLGILLLGGSFKAQASDEYYNVNDARYFENKNPTYFKGSIFEKDQWDIKRVTNNGASFYLESGNHSVVVGIIDSGIDPDHPDIKENFLGGKNFVTAGFMGDETETGDISDIKERHVHGTVIAAQIAGNGRYKGVAPNIGFKSYRALNKDGKSSAYIVAKAIKGAVDDGVNVINLSLSLASFDSPAYFTDRQTGEVVDGGDNFYNYEVIKEAVDYAEAHNVVVVASTGNEGLDCSSPKKLGEINNKLHKYGNCRTEGGIYIVPASFNNVISVSSTGRKDKVSSFSNYGQGFVTVSAPEGELVKADNVYGIDLEELCKIPYKDDYAYDLGTSLAAPKVSAEAALIICKNKNLKPKEVKQKIIDTCDKVGDEEHLGAGIINVYNALKSMY